MKTLTILLAILLSSCTHYTNNAKSVIVVEIQRQEQDKQYSIYHIKNEPDGAITMLRDTTGKWNIGDTIRFN